MLKSTVWFIENVEDTRVTQYMLAALFAKGANDVVEGVLGRVDYSDHDLASLTDLRPELAGLPERFFSALDKINEPEKQGEAALEVSVTCSKLIGPI